MLDMAIICKEAADAFMENTEGFEVAFECFKNSDIFITKDNNPKKIGMVKDRSYQKSLIVKEFGEDVEIVTIIGTGLPYALENGQVDGLIIDYMKSVNIDGRKKSTVIDGEDYTTYVLLVNKEFKKTKEFKRFVKDYNNSLKYLKENDEVLKKQFYKYTKSEMKEGGMDNWKTKLLYLEDDQDTEKLKKEV